MSTPQSTIHLCSGVRLDPRYEHSIYFESPDAQEAYFAGKVVKTFSAYSYLRKSWTIKVQTTMGEATTWNYLYFRNRDGGKVYYYFVNNIEYVNDATVELSLELDVIQTYLFDIQLLPCFVERQHTPTDAIGEYTVEEGLDVGEYKVAQVKKIDPGPLCIMVMCSTNPNAQTEEQAVPALPYMYNGVFSGIKLWAVAPDQWSQWGSQMDKLDEIGKTDSITAMWMYPKNLVKLGGGATWTSAIANPVDSCIGLDDGVDAQHFTVNHSDLDGYKPRNNKMFCYPYNYLYCTNNQGESAVYRYERFDLDAYTDVKVGFTLTGSLSPDGGVRLTPLNYNGLFRNYNEGLTLTNYPTCAWDSDIYKMWLAQNSGMINNTRVGGILKIVGGGAMALAGLAGTSTGVGAVPGIASVGGGVGLATSGFKQIAALNAQEQDRQVEPPQSKGAYSSSVNITNNMHCFTLQYQTVTAERAKIIDDYFTMYGYRISRVQKPNIHARSRFTYIKTIGCHIKGNMCTQDIVKIETIYDQGITFWRNGDDIGNYDTDNNPIG